MLAKYWAIVSLFQALCTLRDYPSKHETLNHRWFNVGPSSTTLAQHWTNNGTMSRVCWDVAPQWGLWSFSTGFYHQLCFVISHSQRVFLSHDVYAPTAMLALVPPHHIVILALKCPIYHFVKIRVDAFNPLVSIWSTAVHKNIYHVYRKYLNILKFTIPRC